MKERPILFKGEMVRAILEGRKTQTRCVVKGLALDWIEQEGFTPEFVANPENGLCPHGQPGDRLFVKETFYAWGRWETKFNAKKGLDQWHFVDMTRECGKHYRYAEDCVGDNGPRQRGGVTPQWWKRQSLFMPRWASRIMLEIISVRVERLQDINDGDAIAEGCDNSQTEAAYSVGWYEKPIKAYRRLWESINGHGSWDSNPWVWVVEFKRVAL